MTPRTLVAALCLTGCGVPLDVEAPAPAPASTPEPATAGPERVTLTLETRDGDSARGYSFEKRQLVELASADLHLNAFDCGARGRWVNLVAGEGVRFCSSPSDDCASLGYQLSAGGSGDDAFTGEAWVLRGAQVLGKVKLIAHSPTPRDWYEQSPIPPFEVTLDLAR